MPTRNDELVDDDDRADQVAALLGAVDDAGLLQGKDYRSTLTELLRADFVAVQLGPQ